MKSLEAIVGGLLITCMIVWGVRAAGESNRRAEIYAQAEAQVNRVVEELDAKTTSSGVYERVSTDELNEPDPWGTPLKVFYSQGGVGEKVVVSSAGPDKTFGSNDDIVRTGIAVNLRGIGNGIRENVEETARGAGKGLVEGVKAGLKRDKKEDK